MADGNAEFAAAILSRLQKQQDAMQALFASVESGIADLADPARMQGVERLLSAIESGIADAVTALEATKESPALDRLVTAIEALKPAVTVDVAPTPVQVSVAAPVVNIEAPSVVVEASMPPAAAPVVHIMPAPQAATWKVTIPGSYGAPARVMTIERT